MKPNFFEVADVRGPKDNPFENPFLSRRNFDSLADAKSFADRLLNNPENDVSRVAIFERDGETGRAVRIVSDVRGGFFRRIAEILEQNAARRNEAMERAARAGGWEKDLAEIRQLRSWEQFLAHPRAAEYAYYYARDVIRGRWPEAEPVIATSPEWAYCYAYDIIKGRWPEGEPAIAASPKWAYWYADLIRGRWPEAETAIAASAKWAYYYARDVIRGRWPEAETAIATSPEWSYWYALDVVRGPWPEGEAAIAASRKWAYKYARNVIRGPWPEGEAAIAASLEKEVS